MMRERGFDIIRFLMIEIWPRLACKPWAHNHEGRGRGEDMSRTLASRCLSYLETTLIFLFSLTILLNWANVR